MALIKQRDQLRAVTVQDGGDLDWREGALILMGGQRQTAVIGFEGDTPIRVGLIAQDGTLTVLDPASNLGPLQVLVQAGVSIEMLLATARNYLADIRQKVADGIDVPLLGAFQHLVEEMDGEADGPDSLSLQAQLVTVLVVTYYMGTGIISGLQWMDEIREMFQQSRNLALAGLMQAELGEIEGAIDNWCEPFDRKQLNEQSNAVMTLVSMFLADEVLRDNAANGDNNE